MFLLCFQVTHPPVATRKQKETTIPKCLQMKKGLLGDVGRSLHLLRPSGPSPGWTEISLPQQQEKHFKTINFHKES